MWRPTNHSAEAIEAFRAKRAEHGIGGVVCHALYLSTWPRPTERSTRSRSPPSRRPSTRRCAIGADGVIFHVGSHLGAGFGPLSPHDRALAQILEHCDRDTWLLIENSAGTGDTIGRSLEELQTLIDRLDSHPRLGFCLDSCHLYASGYDVTDPEQVDELVARSTSASASTGYARSTSTTRPRRSARIVTATRICSKARWARTWAPSSPTRSCSTYPRTWRRQAPIEAGRDGGGHPDPARAARPLGLTSSDARLTSQTTSELRECDKPPTGGVQQGR